MDNPTTVALKLCNDQVLRPYRGLLLTVGWKPWFDYPSSCCARAVNVIHPLVVVGFILIGYVIQYSSCFRRDSAGTGIGIIPLTPAKPLNGSNGTVPEPPIYPQCRAFLVSQYIIPDVLHSLAYVYSFYLLRFAQSEQLTVLMERVFLHTSPTQTGFLSQGKLIRAMRALLLLGICWVLLSLSAQVIHVVAQFDDINFSWLSPGTTAGRVFLFLLMLFGFLALDVVYTAVVISYCVQCALLIFYIEGIQMKLRQKLLDIPRAFKEIGFIESDLKTLNFSTALAMSLVLFNFGTMAFLGAIKLVDPNNGFSTLMLTSTSLSVFFWFSIMVLPIFQAAKLTAACNSLRKIGHEIRVKPFVYQSVPDEELDSLLLYTSTLNMRAKIFLVPVKTSYISLVLVVVGFVMLLLFQTGALHIWLK